MDIQTPCFVLAGGLSKRFGQDKSLYIHENQPLILHITSQLNRWFPSVMVICNSPEKLKSLSLTVFQDLEPQKGPLMGIITGLKIAKSQGYSGYVFFASCDVLGFKRSNLNLLTPFLSQPYDAILFKDVTLEPLWAFYHTNVLPHLQNQYTNGIQSLRYILEDTNNKVINGTIGKNHNYIVDFNKDE